MPAGANATVSVLDAHNGPCVVMQSDVASSAAVKCWGPNGYGSLGLVRGSAPPFLFLFLLTPQVFCLGGVHCGGRGMYAFGKVKKTNILHQDPAKTRAYVASRVRRRILFSSLARFAFV